MKNKVEIRAFAVEQVVKMRCMSDCTIEEVVEQSKLVEGYIMGSAEVPEYGDETAKLMKAVADMGMRMGNAVGYPIMGCSRTDEA